jgi:uncharacterized protein YggE
MLRDLLCTFLLLASATVAQDTAKLAHVVRASGEATVTAKPDRAEITIGVLSQAASAQGASSQNAIQTTAVLDAVRRTLGAKGK